MFKTYWKTAALAALGCFAIAALSQAQNVVAPAAATKKQTIPPAGPAPTGSVDMFTGMPPALDKTNLYSEIASNKLSPNVAGALERV